MTIEVRGVREAARALSNLGPAFEEALQSTLDEVALEAVRGIARHFDASIEGGPAPFTEVRPGSPRSSIVTSKRRRRPSGDGAEASIRVQRLQSAYLKYHLDVATGSKETVRPAGDTGVASTYNLVPTHNLARWQLIRPTPQGGFPRGAVRKLVRRARTKKQVVADARERGRRSIAKKLGLPEGDPQVEALVASRKIRSKAVRRGDFEDMFWGVPKGRSKDKVGFWQRPLEGRWKLIPLVSAQEKTTYPASGSAMQNAWNDGVEKALKMAPDLARRRMELAVSKAAGATGGGGSASASST